LFEGHNSLDYGAWKVKEKLGDYEE